MAAQLEAVEREKSVDNEGVPPEIKLPPRDRRASTERAGRAFLGLEEPEEREKAEPEDGGAASSDRCARAFLGAWCCLFVLSRARGARDSRTLTFAPSFFLPVARHDEAREKSDATLASRSSSTSSRRTRSTSACSS